MSLTVLAIIGGAFLFLAFLVWLQYKLGKGAGAASQQADSATAALSVEKKMAQAGADAPADLKGVAADARAGKF